MDTRVAHDAVDGFGNLQQPLLIFGAVFDDRLQLGNLVEHLLQMRSRLFRDQFRDLVDLGKRHLEHPADASYRLLREHLVERDDLGNLVAAIFLDDEIDDALASFVRKVDVDIGHADAVGVQEPLEQQGIPDRVEIRYPKQVCHDRAGSRAAPRTDGNAHVPRLFDEIPDDEEVVAEAHPANDAQLVIETFCRRFPL
ncbi:MAG: hypothetical protein BWY66_02086 [bacterium ADurb.Bin374]|nr:MAG: hypothetical protein BWY66_02086 [bacterium ADurb.Bin374]